MNSFNKTEAAVFSCRLCFLRAFPFISLSLIHNYHNNIIVIKMTCQMCGGGGGGSGGVVLDD